MKLIDPLVHDFSVSFFCVGFNNQMYAAVEKYEFEMSEKYDWTILKNVKFL